MRPRPVGIRCLNDIADHSTVHNGTGLLEDVSPRELDKKGQTMMPPVIPESCAP